MGRASGTSSHPRSKIRGGGTTETWHGRRLEGVEGFQKENSAFREHVHPPVSSKDSSAGGACACGVVDVGVVSGDVLVSASQARTKWRSVSLLTGKPTTHTPSSPVTRVCSCAVDKTGSERYGCSCCAES